MKKESYCLLFEYAGDFGISFILLGDLFGRIFSTLKPLLAK